MAKSPKPPQSAQHKKPAKPAKSLSPGAALAAMRKSFKGAPKKLAPCPRCGKVLSARERRAACPEHQPK